MSNNLEITNSGYVKRYQVEKGSVETITDLPTEGNTENDVYYVKTEDLNYIWNGKAWEVNRSDIDLNGEKGDKGDSGDKGDPGEPGIRGSRWSTGTAITGTYTTATIFSESGITDALVDDMYLNTTTGNVYKCTVSGTASVAKWVYAGCIQGPSGFTTYDLDGGTP